ncbi:DUF1760-domain-containing protein [Eremomyces bilateralis CBS 781.70]|uniref:DUF1760-domain-containing protein n=1 Tax=Eremomyces bilateralis CBS 781.70 TaxID=1392243 RepID=A0A6G1GAN1_9PEZI|nr:DUF1760-domain-containing protein [Eremomyces bilateralis CBS 781.70]KAF1814960.1 DUF1760-domain-containing protein [Eremomyces bilateralis CBS 781.70]
MEHHDHPFIAALPPEMDYITYLTLVEHNLTKDNLPILHIALQDSKLTVNIGWDLVALLIPLLPESRECLQDVAQLGNPREVVLKVTEALRFLDFDLDISEHEDDDQPNTGPSSVEVPPSSSATQGIQETESETSVPLPILQFETLLSMLSILHPRLKTKFPSRFLSGTLQAILAAYSKTTPRLDDTTESVVKFVKTLTGTKRPHLPPRRSTSGLLMEVTAAAPDPEAQEESVGEKEIQNRLIQSFMTHILEEYMLALHFGDVAGMAWSSRVQEKLLPETKVKGRTTMIEQFATQEKYKEKGAVLGQLVAICQDLDIDLPELWRIVNSTDPEPTGKPEEDDPPESAADIPLSKNGALFLLTAKKVAEILYDIRSPSIPKFSIFPDHAKICSNFIGVAGRNTGLESEALLDTILALAIIAIGTGNVGEPTSDDEFLNYLQATSLISANSPIPQLRGVAHFVTSTILRCHPHDLLRLTFIQDTLQHCPYENLKETAVGWLKGETIEANLGLGILNIKPGPTDTEDDNTTSIFATPVALSSVAPFLWPKTDPAVDRTQPKEAWLRFRINLGFYLAALNFWYLIVTAQPLHEPLGIRGLHATVQNGYLEPLAALVASFKKGLDTGELLEMDAEQAKAEICDLLIVEDALERIRTSTKKAGF